MFCYRVYFDKCYSIADLILAPQNAQNIFHENLTTILCRCHEIWGTLTSWNPLDQPRPVTGLLYLLFCHEKWVCVQYQDKGPEIYVDAHPRSVLENTWEMLKAYNLTHFSGNVFESLQACTEIISRIIPFFADAN